MLIYFLPRDESKVDLVSVVLNGRTLQYGDRLLLGTQPSDRHHDYSQSSILRKTCAGSSKDCGFCFQVAVS